MRVLIQWMDAARQGKTPCLFQILTGYYCPGCGGTRALIALMRGRLLFSFFYHPLVLYVAVVLMLFFLSWIKVKITGNRKSALRFHYAYIYLGVGIVAVNFLVKNFAIGVFGIELLGLLDGRW